MLKYITFKKTHLILESDKKMHEISKYYLEYTKKQHNIMTSKLKINKHII